MAETDKGETVEIRGIGFVGSHTHFRAPDGKLYELVEERSR